MGTKGHVNGYHENLTSKIQTMGNSAGRTTQFLHKQEVVGGTGKRDGGGERQSVSVRCKWASCLVFDSENCETT